MDFRRLAPSVRLAILLFGFVFSFLQGIKAQPPVLPSSPLILGYVHLNEPARLAEKAETIFLRAGRNIPADALKRVAGKPLGDFRIALIPRNQPMSVVWMRSGSAGIETVIVLPEAQETDYFKDCLARIGKTHITREGLTYIGPRQLINNLEGSIASIANLHTTFHPTDISCYFTAPVVAENKMALLRALSELVSWTPESIVALLSGSQAAAGGFRSLLPRALKPLPLWLQVAGRMADDLEMVHIMVDLDQDPLRAVVNLSARPGTPLGLFCSQSAAPANPLPRFLPEFGFVRACANVDGRALAALAGKVLPAAAQANAAWANKIQRLLETAESLSFLRGPAALHLGPASVGKPPFYMAIVTPGLPGGAPGSLRTLLDGMERFRQSPPGSQFVLRKGGTVFEKFPVDYFFKNAGSAGTPAPANQPLDQAFLRGIQVGSSYILTAETPALENTVHRVLRLKLRLNPVLRSQSVFRDHGHFYADFRSKTQAALPWSESGVLLFSGRFGGNHAQFALGVPVDSLGKFPR